MYFDDRLWAAPGPPMMPPMMYAPPPQMNAAYQAIVPRGAPPPVMEEIKYKDVPSVWERSGTVSI